MLSISLVLSICIVSELVPFKSVSSLSSEVRCRVINAYHLIIIYKIDLTTQLGGALPAEGAYPWQLSLRTTSMRASLATAGGNRLPKVVGSPV